MTLLAADHQACPADAGATRMDAIRLGEIGSVYSWSMVTDTDGPGTRLTLRLAGCPLRCQYCYGPDSWLMRDGVIHTVDSVMARIQRDAPVLQASGGGVTISGGEPLLQPAFVARVLRACREVGLNTALDTSGYLGRRITDEMLDDTDLVLLDVKSGLPRTYRTVTGRDLAPTLELGRRLADRGTEIWVRFVVVPGLTDEVENVEAVGEYLQTLGSLTRVDVVPFDQRGRGTWHALGKDYRLEITEAPDDELMDRVRGQLLRRALPVH
ncbi:MAG: pyruvate formate lyase-activating protein [Cellulomonadaceae bacterium]|nr:pyruvate formate lyase-activating protein [Cellulomonadaceae bacterium]